MIVCREDRDLEAEEEGQGVDRRTRWLGGYTRSARDTGQGQDRDQQIPTCDWDGSEDRIREDA